MTIVITEYYTLLLSFSNLLIGATGRSAWRAADRSAVERLIRGTGSTLDVCGVELYGRVVSNPAHAAAALGMMANWDLVPLARDLPRLNPCLMLVTSDNDRTLPPSEALFVRALLPSADRVSLPGLGHLAHEERPEEVAPLFVRLARTTQGMGDALRLNQRADE